MQLRLSGSTQVMTFQRSIERKRKSREVNSAPPEKTKKVNPQLSKRPSLAITSAVKTKNPEKELKSPFTDGCMIDP